MTFEAYFELEAEKFQPTPNELDEDSDDYINPGQFARQLSEYFTSRLEAAGIKTGQVHVEDWGHEIEIEREEKPRISVCCSSRTKNSEHIVFLNPKTPVDRRFFKKYDITEELTHLGATVEAILERDEDIRRLRRFAQ